MAYRSRLCLFLCACAPTSCFDPTAVDLDTDTDATATDPSTGPLADDGDDDGGTCTPGTMQACTCTGGATGEHTCLPDGSGFGPCECEAEDTTGDPPPECVDDADCAGMVTECEDAVCNALGSCELQPLAAGSPCGSSATTSCDAADTCDGAGACLGNLLGEGVACDDCGEELCSCDANAACIPCPDLADANDFETDRSVVGWEVTGGWGLYIAAPQSFVHPALPFDSRVFGSDGSRRVPYPLTETETSTATSRAFVLPAQITFESWHVDEGGQGCGPDRKGVFASSDGVTWLPLADCCLPGPQPPFCQNAFGPRAATDWDPIALPVPLELVGRPGMIQFRYDTIDSCCDFEQGWFIDVANIAPECACVDDGSCADFSGECGTGACLADGQCAIDGRAEGSACGDAEEGTCTEVDTCNGFGFCVTNDAPNGYASCDDCPTGMCGGCVDGACVDCPSDEYDTFDTGAWTVAALEGTTNPGWGVYFSAPQNQVAGSTATSFGARAPVIGTDGNRLPPYDGVNQHAESSTWTTTPFVVPAEISFESWNQDEGGNSIDQFDTKRIEISINAGASWTSLADCAFDAQPFCELVNDRPIDQWDAITLDTSDFEGQTGILRFSYDTQDACCEFERGWYINDLSVLTQCIDPIPAP